MSDFSDYIDGLSGRVWGTRGAWTQDAPLTDDSGNGRTLGKSGSVVSAPGDGIPGDPQGCLDFAGGDFYGEGFSPWPCTTDYTIEGWIKPANLSADRALASLGLSGASLWIKTNGTLQLVKTNIAVIGVGTGTVAADGNWYHVAVSCTAGTATFYINGTAGGMLVSASMVAATAMWLGSHVSGSQFLGLLDEFNVYSRGLTSGEIAQIYTLGSTAVVDAPPDYPPAEVANSIAFGEKIAPLFRLARTERVAMLGIGNSNWLHGGNGWMAGFKNAFSARYGQWGEGPFKVYDALSTAAPSQLRAYFDLGLGSMYAPGYYYRGVGDAAPSGLAGAYFVTTNNTGGSAASAWDARDGFDVTFHYGTFTSGSGKFTPTIGLTYGNGNDAYAGNTIYAAKGATVQTNTGAYGLSRVTVSLAADSARTAYGSYYFAPFSAASQDAGDSAAPALVAYMTWAHPARQSGFSCATLNARGGQPLRALRYDLQQASDATIAYLIAETKRPLGASKATLVIIQEAQNSRNASSVPPQGGGDTPEQYAANLQATIDRMRAVYGGDNLYFLLIGDHALSDPDDAQVIAYRAAAVGVAAANDKTAAVDLSRILTGTELAALGYYADNASDHAHGDAAGKLYDAAALKAVDALMPVGLPKLVTRIIAVKSLEYAA